MILRPHHLLCTQSYEGRGYSAEFIKNMDKNIEILKNKTRYWWIVSLLFGNIIEVDW